MNWLAWLLPIVSGVLDASSRAVIKTTRVHTLTLIAGGCVVALPIYAYWLAIEGVPEVRPAFWRAVALHVPLLTAALILMVEAHRRSPLTLTMPYLSFTPAFLLVVSPIMGGGEPTREGIGGVLILTAGLYVLNSGEGGGIFEPFRAIRREQGSWMMLLVAFIFAFTANLDYIALVNANEPFYLLVDNALIALSVAGAAAFYGFRNRKGTVQFSPKGSFRAISCYGGMIAIAAAAQMLAFRWIKVVPYVIAAKRAGGILATVGLALFLGFAVRHPDFARERERAWYRIVGILLMVTGMTVIILWGTRQTS